MDNFEKQSSEIYTINIDFSNLLNDNSETISTYTVKAYNESIDYTSTVIDNHDNTTTDVNVRTKGGTDGKNYKITVLVTTDQSNVYEKDILMRVIDI
jgi:Flp pilus assembly protein TadG